MCKWEELRTRTEIVIVQITGPASPSGEAHQANKNVKVRLKTLNLVMSPRRARRQDGRVGCPPTVI
jgi:hypothetical protein